MIGRVYDEDFPRSKPLPHRRGDNLKDLPSFLRKRRGSLLIGASQLLITVSALRLASILSQNETVITGADVAAPA
jgi:hypothetical protein